MDPYNDTTIPERFIELKHEIQTNSHNLTLNTIHQTRQDLNSILLQLSEIHNSKLAINRVIPDVLYDIFTLAIYDSPFPGTTALHISHVCRHWRNSALGWPSLWGFVDLGARSLVSLFFNRSGNAPIWLSWTTRYQLPLFERQASISTNNPKLPNFYRSSKLYFESCAKHILPRLWSLILHLTYSEFMEIRHVFQNSDLLPLRLRNIDIGIYTSYHGTIVGNIPLWTDLLPIDVSCLRELKLREVALPWFEPPHRKLTHFSIHYPIEPPTLTQLVLFLSHCPLLVELEVGLSDNVGMVQETNVNSQTTTVVEQPPNNELNFPYLRKLDLATVGSKSFQFVQDFVRYIKNMESLSCFSLKYDYMPVRQVDTTTTAVPFDIFDLVPSQTFSRFADHHYLYISLYRHSGNFVVYSGPNSDFRRLQTGLRRSTNTSTKQLFPLYILGSGEPGHLFDHSPLLELIRAMPEITHLELVSSAWEAFTSWNLDIGTAFPCLDTLELSDSHHPARDCTEVLNSLPSDFKLKTLILKRVRMGSSQVLLDAVSRTGIEVLELGECLDEVEYDVIITLRKRGVVVVLPEESVFIL